MSILRLTQIPERDNIDIMKAQQFLAETLTIFFKRYKIATLDQLQIAMGSPTQRTVFRKLSTLNYLSSYSHRGRYYSLPCIAKFDSGGLWSCRSVWFSRFGNLIETTRAFVHQSDDGYSAAELREALHVETKHTLAQLVRVGELEREKIKGHYIYFLTEPRHSRSQRKRRRDRKKKQLATLIVADPDLAAEEAKALVLLFISTLDERQRRQYAGLESLKLGHGGDHYIAELFGLNPHTVARGREELVEGDWDVDRLRATGGGRTPAEKKRPKS